MCVGGGGAISCLGDPRLPQCHVWFPPPPCHVESASSDVCVGGGGVPPASTGEDALSQTLDYCLLLVLTDGAYL